MDRMAQAQREIEKREEERQRQKHIKFSREQTEADYQNMSPAEKILCQQHYEMSSTFSLPDAELLKEMYNDLLESNKKSIQIEEERQM